MSDINNEVVNEETSNVKSSCCMLTTIDNPFDPFEDFNSWFMYDVDKGYNTCSHLARVAHFSDDMSQKEENDEMCRAIDEIIKYDFLDLYKKVERTTVVKE